MSLLGSKPLSLKTKPGSNEKKETLNRRLYLWLFLLAIVFDVLSVFAFYQVKPEYTITVGAANDSWYIDKFYDVESNATGAYRWSKDGATVTLPPVGTPFEVQVEAQAYRPAPQPSPTFSLDLNSPSTVDTFQGTGTLQNYELKIKSRLDFSLDKVLTIHSPTFQPSKTDDRQLGLLVRQVSIQAQPNSFGFVTPPVWVWLTITFGLAVVQGTVFLNVLPRRRRYFGFLPLVTFVLPLLLFGAGLAFPLLALENAFSVGMGLCLLGFSGLALYLSHRIGKICCAGLLALGVAGVFTDLFNFVGLAVFCAGLILLVFLYNPRLNRTGFNLLIVAAVGLLPCWGLLQQRAFVTIDGESHHLYWLNELNLMVKEGDFFPRWAPHFSYNRGNTVFMFYAPLSRYLGEFFVLGGLTPAFAFLAALVGITIASGLSMYFLARDFVRGPGAVMAAVAYLYNPYRLADMYQRGDIAEALNFVFFPLALLAVSRTLRFNRQPGLKLIAGGGISFSLMLISHQLSAFYFGVFVLFPFVLFCLARFLWQERKTFGSALRKVLLRLGYLAAMVALGVGLSAFYIVPLLLETKFIRVDTKVDIDSTYGFLEPNLSNWKDWVSSIRPLEWADKSMTNLAWFGPTSLMLALLGALSLLLPGKSKKRFRGTGLFFAGLIVVLLVMQMQFTLPFWKNVPGMIFIQFPWRLMIYVALLASLLIGVLADFIFKLPCLALVHRPNTAKLFMLRHRNYRLSLLSGLVVISLLGLGLAFTGSGRVDLNYYPPSFSGTYSTGTLINQFENGDLFYLPIWARSLDTLDKDPYRAYIVRDGQPQTDGVNLTRLKSAEYNLDVNATAPGTLIIPIFYFDGWTLTQNGQNIPVSYNQPQGYIQATVPAGNYSLTLSFENNVPRTVGDASTFLALALLLFLAWKAGFFRFKFLRLGKIKRLA
ncbi:MAG: hypothetical protein J0I20_12565 [Chloroflexi bacterium]|nr:hypothetical protein [Chloroflexota bacterium]OJV92545.1 MAG: hypothetical protein BGO39_32070 [Chloroflexi bacterium 54-19]